MIRHIATLLITMAGFALTCRADDIHLKDGSLIKGTILRATPTSLTVKTTFSPSVDIPMALVTQFSSQSTLHIHTTTPADGQTSTNGPVTYDSKTKALTLQDNKTVIPWTSVKAINPKPPKSPWTAKAFLGATSQNGNTSRRQLNVSTEAKRTRKKDVLTLKFRNRFAENDGVKEERHTHGSVAYERNIGKQFFVLLSEELSGDDKQKYVWRSISSAGIGYTWLNGPVHSLKTDLGFAYRAQNNDDADDIREASGRTGLQYQWKINAGLTAAEQLTYYPSLENGSDQVHHEASLHKSLSERWGLKLTHQLEYETKPSQGLGRSDNTWMLGLQYEFK